MQSRIDSKRERKFTLGRKEKEGSGLISEKKASQNFIQAADVVRIK